MAFIEQFNEEYKDFRRHEPAYTTYSTGRKDGTMIFQINMYGSDVRRDVGKVSQVIQLDKTSAIELINLLKNTFNL